MCICIYICINGSVSIAMLNYQRVVHHVLNGEPKLRFVCFPHGQGQLEIVLDRLAHDQSFDFTGEVQRWGAFTQQGVDALYQLGFLAGHCFFFWLSNLSTTQSLEVRERQEFQKHSKDTLPFVDPV